jgi:hypothetical protein
MVVRIDGMVIGSSPVSTPEWTDYEFSFDSTASTSEIAIEFTNDFYDPPVDRNLLVDRIIMSCETGGEPPPEPPPPGTCSIANAVDLGQPGTNVTIPNDGCAKVESGYPEWWGTRTMRLDSTTPGVYPAPFQWSNACAGTGGSGLFSGDWQAQPFGPTSDACPTLIDFSGAGDGNLTLRYWAN